MIFFSFSVGTVCVTDGVMILQSLINVNGRTAQLFSVNRTFSYTLYNPSINTIRGFTAPLDLSGGSRIAQFHRKFGYESHRYSPVQGIVSFVLTHVIVIVETQKCIEMCLVFSSLFFFVF